MNNDFIIRCFLGSGRKSFEVSFHARKKKNFLATRIEGNVTKAALTKGWKRAMELFFFHANFDATEMDRSYAGNSIPYPVRKRGRFPGRCALAFDPIRGQRCMKLSSLLRDIAKQWTVSVQ